MKCVGAGVTKVDYSAGGGLLLDEFLHKFAFEKVMKYFGVVVLGEVLAGNLGVLAGADVEKQKLLETEPLGTNVCFLVEGITAAVFRLSRNFATSRLGGTYSHSIATNRGYIDIIGNQANNNTDAIVVNGESIVAHSEANREAIVANSDAIDENNDAIVDNSVAIVENYDAIVENSLNNTLRHKGFKENIIQDIEIIEHALQGVTNPSKSLQADKDKKETEQK